MLKKKVFLGALIPFVIVSSAVAAPASAQQARTAVQAWLNADIRPLDADMGSGISDVQIFSGEDGKPVYYVVNLQPCGFVIVPADDLVEPIICFVDDGTYDPSSDNPLGALVSRDLPNRIAAVRNLQTAQARAQSLNQQQQIFQQSSVAAQTKWNELLTMAHSPSLLGISIISDVRVAPLVQSTWGQTELYWCTPPLTCYNYSTPDNSPCGCVATAMAQLIRYYQKPAAYTWSDMPLQPGCSITTAQRQAIGDLCRDAAVSIDTEFDPNGSSAYIWKVRDALPETFGYDNVIHASDDNNDISSGLTNMVNPNLDAGKPVILGIIRTGSDVGHAVLADGYGYDFSTPYHHINMGWDGYDDAWYNLPNIDSSYPGPFDSIPECIYNVFFNEAGEIISGRVTNEPTGIGISGAEVTAVRSGGGTYNATTNDKGIYALWAIPSASNYTVSVTKDGYIFTPSTRDVNTGTSTNEQPVSGNQWAIDFEGLGSSTGGYCFASSQNCGQDDEYISRVQIGDIDNGSGCDGYADYTDISTQISGTSHIKVTNGNGYAGDLCGVWIDWNQDRVFDSNEELVLEAFDDGPYEGDITVPADANQGYTRMRVRIQYLGELNPCDLTETGEVEDYNLAVTTGGGCDIVNIGTGTYGWILPMYTYWEDSRTQVIYHADQIGTAGTITALALDVATIPGLTMDNWTIRMKHTSLSTYTANNLENTDWTIVYQADETVTDIGWYTFNFSTPFVYNGSDNLLVDFSFNNNDYAANGQCRATNSGATRSLYASSDSEDGDPLDWSGSSDPTVYNSPYIPNLKLTICTDNEAERTLTVASSNPDSGVLISVTPADSNGDSDGVTPFTRIYSHYTAVTLSAPITADGNSFKKWQLDGSDSSNILDTVVTMDANYTLTAVYEQILLGPLTVDLIENGLPDFSDFSEFAQSWAEGSCLPPDWCQGRDFDHNGTVDKNDLQIFCEFWLWPVADIDLNGEVNFVDYAMLTELWGQTPCESPGFCNGCDLDKSYVVDINDLAQMTMYWLFGD